MSINEKLSGVYVITDDTLTPGHTVYKQVVESLQGGTKIVQLRDKESEKLLLKEKALFLQEFCARFDATFVLNDHIDIAIDINCDALHIGKSDHHRFEDIRKEFDGYIGVSCYGDVELAKEFEKMGADYVAFGSFYHSHTKPSSNIISLDVLTKAKKELNIPVCAIGGINTTNIHEVMEHKPDMVSLINDIWSSEDIKTQTEFYSQQFK